MPKVKKNPAAVALAKRSREVRMKNMTSEQRSEQGRRAVNSRRDRQKPGQTNPEKWYGLFACDDPNFPELIMYSRDKAELRQRAKAEDRALVIEDLDYDPQVRIPIVPKYEPDTAARLQALQDLQLLDADTGKGGRS